MGIPYAILTMELEKVAEERGAGPASSATKAIWDPAHGIEHASRPVCCECSDAVTLNELRCPNCLVPACQDCARLGLNRPGGGSSTANPLPRGAGQKQSRNKGGASRADLPLSISPSASLYDIHFFPVPVLFYRTQCALVRTRIWFPQTGL